MKTRSTITLSLLAVFFVAPLQAEDKVSKAQALINKAVKAMGGAKAVKRTANAIIDDKGTFYGMGMALPYSGRFVHSLSAKGVRLRMEIKMAFVSVLNGDTGWRSGGGFTEDVKGKALEVAKQQGRLNYIVSLIPLLKPNKAYKLSSAKPQTINGERCQGVKVSHKGTPDVSIWFSSKSGLIRKYSYKIRVEEAGFKEVQEEAIQENYKKFDGIPSPVKVTVKRGGKKFVLSTPTKYTYPKKISDKEFNKPK